MADSAAREALEYLAQSPCSNRQEDPRRKACRNASPDRDDWCHRCLAQDALAAEPAPSKEYIILHAPGWPGGYMVVPNSLEAGQAFVRENGGELKWRWTCDWQKAPEEADHG